MRMLIIVSALLLSNPVLAEPRCAQFGDAPIISIRIFAPKIIKWVTGVEKAVDSPRPLSKIAALQLQANVGNWKETARSTLINSIFILVEHGVNVDIETFDNLGRCRPRKRPSTLGRALLDWTQQKLAEAAGLLLSPVVKFERSGRTVAAGAVQAMKRALENAEVDSLRRTAAAWV